MITTRTRIARVGGIALVSIATLALVPWKLTAQSADAEALAKLKEENAKLREQVEAMRRDAEQMRSDAEQLRKRVVDERPTEASILKANSELLSRSAHEQSRNVERQQRAMEKIQAELRELRTRFTEDHPSVRERQAQLETLVVALDAAALDAHKADLKVGLEPSSLTKTASAPASERAIKRHEQQRALLQKEVELGVRHVEHVRRALENGKEIPTSLLAAQRELLDTKLQLARISGSKADERAVLMQQLNIAEGMLKEQRKRVEVGTTAPGAEIPFERELLRIKRELYALDAPDLKE